MLADALSWTLGLIARALGASTGQLSARFARLVRRLAEHHLRLAREEAAEEARRLGQGLALLILAMAFLSCAALMGNLALVAGLRELARLSWLAACLTALGLDLALAVALLLGAAAVLRGPYMVRTRRTLTETAALLRDP